MLGDVRSVSKGGYVQLRDDDCKTERELRITRAADGSVAHGYQRDGDKQAWDGEAMAWFARGLLRLDRHTSFAADVRVPSDSTARTMSIGAY